MTIALLCPTKGRPEQFSRMIKSVKATANSPDDIIIYAAISPEDSEQYDLTDCLIYHCPDGMPTAHKWNMMASVAYGKGAKILMLCADDVIFSTPLWDKALLDHYEALDNKIHAYHLFDVRTGHGTPHPIVTREWIEAMGYFIPPFFLHWFVDTWTVEMAKAAHCFTHMTDYELQHDKPSDKGKPDKTHTGIRDMGWHARDTWVHEHCQHILEFEKRRLCSQMLRGMSMNDRGKSPIKSYGVI